ncbi:MAG TPA: Zn-ribbon domain-containing OB-fold protein [Actinomycetota bacterium]|nr:Zn-ribbon domain-containing OB-fold protein [Actinomycetota bacterium]
MLEPPLHSDQARLIPGTMPISHRYTAGVAGELFFRALADRGVFLAARCGGCGISYCPPRVFCERCFATLRAEREVGPGGRLVSVTTVRIGLDGAPLPEPVAVGLIRLEGADTCLVHRLEPGAGWLEPGDGVEAVLLPPGERTGSLADISHFRGVPR